MNDAPSPDGPLHATGDQDGPKSESTPTTEEDTLLVDAGGKTHSVSRAKLLKQQRISHLCDLAQDPGVHHTALEGVSPECADAFMTYLQTGAVTPENTALPPLGQAGQTHQLLALAQECHHLERKQLSAKQPEQGLRVCEPMCCPMGSGRRSLSTEEGPATLGVQESVAHHQHRQASPLKRQRPRHLAHRGRPAWGHLLLNRLQPAAGSPAA